LSQFLNLGSESGRSPVLLVGLCGELEDVAQGLATGLAEGQFALRCRQQGLKSRAHFPRSGLQFLLKHLQFVL